MNNIESAAREAFEARLRQRNLPMIDLRPESTIAETGLDSLDVIELWFELEEKLGVELPEAQIRECKTFGDLVAVAQSVCPAKN